jgi:hypothetical protein
MNISKQFRKALNVSTPLIAVRTPDQTATMFRFIEGMNGSASDRPLLKWDMVNGMTGINKLGKDGLITALRAINKDEMPDPRMATMNATDSLVYAAELPPKSILFWFNAHMPISSSGNESSRQGVFNLRELYKQNGRAFVMLCPSIQLPDELRSDVVILDEPLPDREELKEITGTVVRSAPIDLKLKEGDIDRAADRLSGLSAFLAEQVVAMSLTKTGLDMEILSKQHYATIEQTPGLTVYRGQERFADLGGLANAKEFFTRYIEGAEPPRVIVFEDEIEKAMGGAGSDTSGVSQALLGYKLSWMQDKGVVGMIMIGPGGSGKSAIAKAVGNEAGVPTIQFDLSGLKSSFVGSSEANMRAALKVIEAVGQGRILCIATCNSIGVLPPELRRRYTLGTWFVDLPDVTERQTIWSLYLKKFGLEKKVNPLSDLPKDTDWTGAEIRTCCDLAYRLSCPLKEAAKYIVPVAVSASDKLRELRMAANGKYVSASYSGLYQMNVSSVVDAAMVGAPSRQVRLED